MYVCMYVSMYVRMHVRMYACMHVCMYAFMYECMHVCTYVRTYNIPINALRAYTFTLYHHLHTYAHPHAYSDRNVSLKITPTWCKKYASATAVSDK